MTRIRVRVSRVIRVRVRVRVRVTRVIRVIRVRVRVRVSGIWTGSVTAKFVCQCHVWHLLTCPNSSPFSTRLLLYAMPGGLPMVAFRSLLTFGDERNAGC